MEVLISIFTWYQIWSEESSDQWKHWQIIHHTDNSTDNTLHKQDNQSQGGKHNVVHGSCRQQEEEDGKAQGS